jgi:hypothetical protein
VTARARTTARSLARRTLAVVAAVAVGAGLVATPASAEQDGTVYSVPYAPTLFLQHAPSGMGPARTTLDLATWQAAPLLGRAPVPVLTLFIRYRWSPRIYAMSLLAPLEWHRLTPEEWAYAGSPTPLVYASGIPGSKYVVFPPYPEVYAMLDGYGEEFSGGEWQEAGTPGVYPSSNHSWSPPFYLKLPWSPGIALFKGDQIELLTLERWVDLGQPEPTLIPMLPRDEVCFVGDGPSIAYDGATFSGVLTVDQWLAAGSPRPAGAC